MNSEELEQSLRAEFESYLKDVFGDIRRELDGFREKLDAEFRLQRERVDEALTELESRAFPERELQESFRETVAEHLRLAKDEGARITATAIAEAEELHGSGPGEDRGAAFGGLRDAIADISSKTSQADILTALVEHAAEYTPRGAFFIVKNEFLVGWKVFGLEEHEEPEAVRELYFPLSDRTALSEAIESLATVEAVGEGFSDAEAYLGRLGFEDARKMFAIPLVARGRGVAVLYADCGENGGIVNSEALETLVRVAGLTVELLASTPHAGAPVRDHAAESHTAYAGSANEGGSAGAEEPSVEPAFEAKQSDSFAEAPEDQDGDEARWTAGTEVSEPAYESERVEDAAPESDEFESAGHFEEPEDTGFVSPEPVAEDRGFAFGPSEPEPEQETEERFEPETEVAAEAGYDFATPVAESPVEEDEQFAATFEPVEAEISAEERFDAEVEELYEYEEPAEEPGQAEPEAEAEYAESPAGFSFAPSESEAVVDTEAASEDPYGYGSLSEEAEKAEAEYEAAHPSEPEREEYRPEAAAQPAEAVAADTGATVRRRFGDRNIDLPIEVPEEERQYHNAARRFARLLVSEIRLYNEQKVNEGCEAGDLYDRLREAIDRSREMYEKRVHGPVAEKFDYFNYELVNNLAQGDESKLGGSYPGPTV